MMKTTIKTCTQCSAVYDAAATHVCAPKRAKGKFETASLPKIGMVIDKKYRLISKLGEGGMGSVFRARRMFINDFVALKFMRPEVVASEDLRQRFYHEAQVLARIKHPNVVAVYDFGESTEGLPYLVMEFLAGQSLGELLQKNGPMELEQVLEVGIQVCEALTCMLEHNVIHRDLKPDNIMLAPAGREGLVVKIVDFGVAKTLESDQQLTRVQSRIGSPAYSSPEQYLGQYVDHRTDLYGLGVMFYELLTGHVPFEALTQNDLLAAIVHKMPPRLDEKIDGLTSLMADLVQWLLAKDPNDRPRDATEVRRCLQTLRDGKKTLMLYEDQRRAQPIREAAGLKNNHAVRTPNVRKSDPLPRAKSNSAKPAVNKASDSPVFRPRSTRRRIKRKLKRWAKPAVIASALAVPAVIIWWFLAGRPSLQERWPIAPLTTWMDSEIKSRTPATALPRLPAQTVRADSTNSQRNPANKNGGLTALDSINKKSTLEMSVPRDRGIAAIVVNNQSEAPRENKKTSVRPIAVKRNVTSANQLPPEMIFIKDTTYQRGDIFGEGAPNEKPVHTVRIKNFYISAHEVTNEEYIAFVEDTKGNLPEWMDSASKYYYLGGTDSFYKKIGTALFDPKHPVIGVSWTDAMKYCEWLSRKGPWRYRLPTEAEWELAARGGSQRNKFSWGEGAPQRNNGGNVADEALKQVLPNLSMIWRSYNDTHIYTAPVGAFGANAFGLYDMTGNVWEWCLDWYAADAYQKRESVNPQGPTNGTEKAIRGGSWSDTPDKLRVTYRRGVPLTFRSNNLGFRVVAEAPPTLVNNNSLRK